MSTFKELSQLISVNDIQMVSHIPNVMCPNVVNIPVIDLPSKRFISKRAIEEKLSAEIQKFKERFPRETKWLMYAPQDGDPPIPNWGYYYNMADKVVAMSKYGQQVFKQYFDMDVPYIWHGVDTNLFQKRDKPTELQNYVVFGNLNRNQPRKQPVRTIQAFAKFAKDKDDVLLHMQMDWNDQFGWPIGYFVQLYGIQNKVIPPKRVGMPREEVAATYNLWDLNLHATGGEGFGLCISEGMSSGLPTLATDYTTSKELIIDGNPSPRGSLLKVSELYWDKLDVAAVRRSLVDIDDFVKVLNKYYYNKDLVEEHGKNAREWTEKNLAWKIIQKKWKNQVDDILSN